MRYIFILFKKRKKNIVIHILVNLSLSIIVVSAISRILNMSRSVDINEYRTSLIDYVIGKEGVVISIFIIISLILFDLFYKKNNIE